MIYILAWIILGVLATVCGALLPIDSRPFGAGFPQEITVSDIVMLFILFLFGPGSFLAVFMVLLFVARDRVVFSLKKDDF